MKSIPPCQSIKKQFLRMLHVRAVSAIAKARQNEDECLQRRLLFGMTAHSVSRANANSSTWRAAPTALADARQSFYAVADTPPASPFAMARTKLLGFKTSSRRASFPLQPLSSLRTLVLAGIKVPKPAAAGIGSGAQYPRPSSDTSVLRSPLAIHFVPDSQIRFPWFQNQQHRVPHWESRVTTRHVSTHL
jgi:hypothetical protein